MSQLGLKFLSHRKCGEKPHVFFVGNVAENLNAMGFFGGSVWLQ